MLGYSGDLGISENYITELQMKEVNKMKPVVIDRGVISLEKPILFNTGMVKAILDGKKTCTRRIIKPQIKDNGAWGYTMFTPKKHISFRKDNGEEWFIKKPYEAGDILWVRETWQESECFDWNIKGQYAYKADFEEGDITWEPKPKWRPSIHMPRKAARIFLKVTNIRAERLQDITEEQALSEGIRSYTKDEQVYKYAVNDEWWINYCNNNKKFFHGTWWQEMPKNPWVAFMYLWDSTIKKNDLDQYGWGANPWVWVIEFEKIKP